MVCRDRRYLALRQDAKPDNNMIERLEESLEVPHQRLLPLAAVRDSNIGSGPEPRDSCWVVCCS